MMFYSDVYSSPIGGITLASDGKGLVGLWFDGQKYYLHSLPEPPMYIGSSSEPPMYIGSSSAPPVYVGSPSEPPVHVGSPSEPPVHVGSPSEPPVYVGSSSEPTVYIGSSSAPPVYVGSPSEPPADLCRPSGRAEQKNAALLLASAKRWLDRYFAGEKPLPGELPLAPIGSPFRQAVWKILCEIPYGETTTYGAIAKKLALLPGRETMSAQAVGGAVAHNPISVIIPCHRVLGSDGSLTGYAGGIEKKIWLLKKEGFAAAYKKQKL